MIALSLYLPYIVTPTIFALVTGALCGRFMSELSVVRGLVVGVVVVVPGTAIYLLYYLALFVIAGDGWGLGAGFPLIITRAIVIEAVHAVIPVAIVTATWWLCRWQNRRATVRT